MYAGQKLAQIVITEIVYTFVLTVLEYTVLDYKIRYSTVFMVKVYFHNYDRVPKPRDCTELKTFLELQVWQDTKHWSIFNSLLLHRDH